MTVREMIEADCKAVGALYSAAWREGYKGLLPKELLDKITPERYEVRSHVNGFLNEGSFVAVEGERIVAHCHARAADEPKMRGWGEIHTLYTHPEYWRQGCGTAVFRRAEEWLYDRGFDDVYLYVLESNERAERFYRSQGFFPNMDTLCCDLGGEVVTDNRFIKHYPRSTRYGEAEEKTAESGAAAIAEVLENGGFKQRSGLLLCLDMYLDPYYKKTLPEREKVLDVLRGYEKTAADSTLFAVRELLNYV